MRWLHDWSKTFRLFFVMERIICVFAFTLFFAAAFLFTPLVVAGNTHSDGHAPDDTAINSSPEELSNASVPNASTLETDWQQLVIPNEERNFNFQTVPKGTTPTHRFVLKNPFQEPLHIGTLTSTCVCTTIDFSGDRTLQTYEAVVIPIRLRGDLYEGIRNSTITIIIEKPFPAEIQLNVRGEIRSDLTVQPERIDFGNVELGKEVTRTLLVTHTGNNTQWRLVDTRCDNEHIKTHWTADPAQLARRTFRVHVTLTPSAPNGVIDVPLYLFSNDATMRREIPIRVRASVGTVVRVTPPVTSLGILEPGEPSPQKNALLMGTRPFRVTKIECDNPAVEVKLINIAPDAPPQQRYHLSIGYRNSVEDGRNPQGGTMRARVKVFTDVPGLEPAFYVTASIPTEK